MHDLPPKIWLPQKPAIIRAASMRDVEIAMPLTGTFAAAAVRGLRSPAISTGNKYFNIVQWTGTGSSVNVTGVGFQPDTVLIKRTETSEDWALYDSQRGVQNKWPINTTSAQSTDTNGLTAFGADGFTVGTSHSSNGANYIAFCWRKGSAQHDVVKYTGDGVSGRMVNHGLGVTPGFSINGDLGASFEKCTNTNGNVWAATTAKFISGGYTNTSTYTTGTHSSTQFRTANPAYDNTSSAANCMGYVFGDLAGYSKIGSYTGNGSATGPTVSLGFKAKFIMITVNGSGGWFIVNSVRSPSNPVTASLQLNSTDAESTSNVNLDINDTDFQIKSATLLNSSGSTYFYMAFA
jgi:hypothetical protein